MIRIDPSKWTADFRISRALAEAYESSGLDDIVLFCLSEQSTIGRLGVLVADEAVKYYPNVIGGEDDPVTIETAERHVAELFERYVDCFIIGVEAGYGRAAHLGSVEITDRDPSTIDTLRDVVDVTVNVVLRERTFHGHQKRVRKNGASVRRGLEEGRLEVGTDVPDDDDDASPYARREKFKPLRPDEITSWRVQQLADTVIDGYLRFLSRIGKQPL